MSESRSAAHQRVAANLNVRAARKAPLRITRGRKSPGGGVSGRDRLWIADNGADESGVCALPAAYAAWNAERVQDPATRRTLHLTLLSSRWLDERDGAGGCATLQLRKQTDAREGGPKGRQTPTGAPWCSSYDGERAQRWTGTEYRSITCPSQRCEYRAPGLEGPVACQRRVRITAQLRWPEGPCPACAGTGLRGGAPCPACEGRRAWAWGLPEQVAVIDAGGPFGFAADFAEALHAEVSEQWAAVAASIGADATAPNFYGLPVRVTLERWTSRTQRREQWLPRFYLDFPPGMTLQAWAAARVEQSEAARPLIEGRWQPPTPQIETDAEWEPAGDLSRPAGAGGGQ